MAKTSRPPRKAFDNLPAECPICRYRFSTGILGWDKHVGTFDKHPDWHPELKLPAERQAVFAAEFPEFFSRALTPSRRRSPQDRSDQTEGVEVTGIRASPAAQAIASEARCPTCGGPVEIVYKTTRP